MCLVELVKLWGGETFTHTYIHTSIQPNVCLSRNYLHPLCVSVTSICQSAHTHRLHGSTFHEVKQCGVDSHGLLVEGVPFDIHAWPKVNLVLHQERGTPTH